MEGKLDKFELINRTQRIAIVLLRHLEQIPSNKINIPLINQLVRCCTSVGANYRAACRAKSTADFIYKLKIVEEEADETIYFLEILSEMNEQYKEEFKKSINEYNQILAIVVASIKTAKNNMLINQKS